MKDLQLSDSLIIRLFPLARNHLEVRLENLQDKFDASAKPVKVDLKKYLDKVYASVNEGKKSMAMNIEEMSL